MATLTRADRAAFGVVGLGRFPTDRAFLAREAQHEAARLIRAAGGHSAVADVRELRPAARAALARGIARFVWS